MIRMAQRINLPAENQDEYLRLHDAVWPEVERTLTEAGVRNYSIFLDGEDLFAYFEIDDTTTLAEASKYIARDPCTREWWRLTDPLQCRRPNTPSGEQWLTLRQVWHLD